MMPADKYSYVSSRLVREVAQIGGPVKGLVPEVVEQKLREKLDPAYKFHDDARGQRAWAAVEKQGRGKRNHAPRRPRIRSGFPTGSTALSLSHDGGRGRG